MPLRLLIGSILIGLDQVEAPKTTVNQENSALLLFSAESLAEIVMRSQTQVAYYWVISKISEVNCLEKPLNAATDILIHSTFSNDVRLDILFDIVVSHDFFSNLAGSIYCIRYLS